MMSVTSLINDNSSVGSKVNKRTDMNSAMGLSFKIRKVG
jgi:hypothetical protein